MYLSTSLAIFTYPTTIKINKIKYKEKNMSNKVKKESSIEWFFWCDEAFQKAEKENKAIFISIAYYTCSLCHEMKERVIEDEICSKTLNESFVCIKLDREERPDLDKYYQNVHQLLNNRAGGWPLSVFCTPQNKPFFAGTYITLESEVGSIEGMGFKELTKLIASKVDENDLSLYQNADEVEDFLAKETHPTEATVLKESFVKNFMLQCKNSYETSFGGFSVSPKFPQTNTLNTLMTIDKLYADKAAKAMVINTLNEMKKGGMYDLENGGFYRYCTDIEWKVPHLEKTLYDNALLCEAYRNAYATYKDDSYLQVAKECADFWYNFMQKDGLFYSVVDTTSQDTIYDKKIQTSWSAMMIKALFNLGQIDVQYTQKAKDALDVLLESLYIDSQLYHTTFVGEKPDIKAFLEDYAFLSSALIQAFTCTKDEMYLIQAQRFTNSALEYFYKNGNWNFSDGDFTTKVDIYDNTYTSAVSVMVDVMLSIGVELKDEKYTHFAFKTMEYNSYELGRKPVHSPYMLSQMLRYLGYNKNTK